MELWAALTGSGVNTRPEWMMWGFEAGLVVKIDGQKEEKHNLYPSKAKREAHVPLSYQI